MSRYLLDTHTAIWFFDDDDALSKMADSIICDLSNVKYLSIASAWEIAIKISIGKMKFKRGAAGFLRLAEENGFIIIPIQTEHLTTFETLPFIHRDPFDRLLIATALSEELTLVTSDKNIALYNVSQIW